MKTINPFKRLNKEDFIPCSLFPASKVCDTSMDIGRATPLYCLDMVAGNRVSLDVSQLTRFQPMLAPVMTNYSVEFGAFFVPYVALDEFFSSTWFRTNCQNTDVQRKNVLRAREFFNPAIDNSEKVHPWFFNTQRCGKHVNWVGSIYDHLRAPLGLPDWSVDTIYASGVSSKDDSERVTADLNKQITIKGNSSLRTDVATIFKLALYDVGSMMIDGVEVIQPLSLLVLNPQVVKPSKVESFRTFVDTVQWATTGDPETQFSLTNLVSSDRTVDIGKYVRRGSITISNTVVGTLANNYHIGSYVFSDPSQLSPHSWSPYNQETGNIDIDAFLKLLWNEWFHYVPEGVFDVSSSGDITYTSGSSEGVAGKIVLSSLFDSIKYTGFGRLVSADYASPDLSVYSSLPFGSNEVLSFAAWLMIHVIQDEFLISEYERVKNGTSSVSLQSTINSILGDSAAAALHVDTYDNLVSAAYHLYGLGSSTLSWSDIFGKKTVVALQNGYRSYIESLWISANRNLEWNSVHWLCYHRIFADWFLNEHYTKHEDYLDLVGSAYIAGAQSLTNGDGKTMDDWFKSGQLADGNNPKVAADPTLSYFADRIARGECMPVLWSLDSVTNLRQTTSTSSTPIGQSITENFYNRFYARFKDLINRMGPDYRRNARALYGKGPDDASLLRSQVVGYRSFDVQIGDVAQNSESTQESNLGQFAGYAVSRDRAGSFDWTAQESGVFIVLAWVRPKYTCFSDLVPRSLYKREYMDYLIPQFGGVGYQDFSYRQLNPTDPHGTSRLGFEERYSEYMMMDNECSGLMRTSMAYYNSNRIGTPCYAPNTADFYHLLYMDEESDLKRVFVDNVNDPVLISAYFNGNVTRQLPATIKTEF